MSDDEESQVMMPFVACRSNGGIYDDQAFVVGFMLGTIDMQMRLSAALNLPWGAPTAIPDGAVAQAELIAMKHKWFMHYPDILGEELVPGWTWVTFSQDPNTQGETH